MLQQTCIGLVADVGRCRQPLTVGRLHHINRIPLPSALQENFLLSCGGRQACYTFAVRATWLITASLAYPLLVGCASNEHARDSADSFGGAKGKAGAESGGGTAGGAEAAGQGGLEAAGGSAGHAGSGPAVTRADDDPLPACLAHVPVANSVALKSALGAARAGDCIELADGDYVFPFVSSTGTAGAPIVIRAAHAGKASVSSGALVFTNASYVAVEGLTWTSSGGVKVSDSDHCRVTRCRFALNDAAGQDWIVVSGTSSHTRIDHNELGPKRVLGNLIMLSGVGSQVVQYSRIDHNYFHDVEYAGGNGWETIRAGLSQLALSSGYTVIEHNLFQRCAGDPETISVKSSDNTVRYNTLLDSKGEVTLRHGNRNMVYGNYLLGEGQEGTGGIRVCGRDHRIYNNYIQAVSTPAIVLEAGDSDASNEAGTAHYRVYRAAVAFNTVVSTRGIQIGGGGHEFSPVDSVVANNIVQATTGPMIAEFGAPLNSVFLGNLVHPLGAGTPGVNAGPGRITARDPELMPNGSIFSITATSPAIDGSSGEFAYVREDVAGLPRYRADIGAEEFAVGAGPYRPLTPAEVGLRAP